MVQGKRYTEPKADENHGVKSDDANGAEVAEVHAALEAAIICIGDNKAAQNEKEIDGKKALAEQIGAGPDPPVMHENGDCRDASQKIQGEKVFSFLHQSALPLQNVLIYLRPNNNCQSRMAGGDLTCESASIQYDKVC